MDKGFWGNYPHQALDFFVSAKPVIFISHSTKNLPSEDKCVLVKNELVKVLEAKGWRVFLD